jgi:hypothetical protein
MDGVEFCLAGKIEDKIARLRDLLNFSNQPVNVLKQQLHAIHQCAVRPKLELLHHIGVLYKRADVNCRFWKANGWVEID